MAIAMYYSPTNPHITESEVLGSHQKFCIEIRDACTFLQVNITNIYKNC